jgi:phosphohistidine phosphatase
MAVFLVQHGRAISAEIDPLRPLTAEGIKETFQIASVAEYYKIKVSEILHSGKLRARQTAEVLAGKLKPERGISENLAILPDADCASFAATLKPEQNLMLVSHLPFLPGLLSLLLTGKPDQQLFKFQNSGIVCLIKDNDKNIWQINWTLSPHIS